MEKGKWLKTALFLGFICFGGIFYSCRGGSNQEPYVSLQSQENNQVSTLADEEDISEKEVEPSPQYIYIHICGAVMLPDVYMVEDTKRLIDVIKLAGGLTVDAADDYVNLAALVEDGEQIYIPTKEEVKDVSLVGYQESESDSDSSKVNINTATAEVLMTLTGIGKAKADSIITYRQENGGFKTIEEIKNIDGIKDSVFNKINDMIIVK